MADQRRQKIGLFVTRQFPKPIEDKRVDGPLFVGRTHTLMLYRSVIVPT